MVIRQKVLTENLRSMERGGIIARTVYPEVPPRVEYVRSELGDSGLHGGVGDRISGAGPLEERIDPISGYKKA
jgi:hypothetical protein